MRLSGSTPCTHCNVICHGLLKGAGQARQKLAMSKMPAHLREQVGLPVLMVPRLLCVNVHF